MAAAVVDAGQDDDADGRVVACSLNASYSSVTVSGVDALRRSGRLMLILRYRLLFRR